MDMIALALTCHHGACACTCLTDTQGIAPILMLPRTYQPSVVRRKRRFGFLKRNSTPSGRRVLLRRRIKGRANAT
jgi:large subunit ribosomal protein L34